MGSRIECPVNQQTVHSDLWRFLEEMMNVIYLPTSSLCLLFIMYQCDDRLCNKDILRSFGLSNHRCLMMLSGIRHSPLFGHKGVYYTKNNSRISSVSLCMGENKFIKVHVGFFSAILKTSGQDNASCGQNIHTSKKGEKLKKNHHFAMDKFTPLTGFSFRKTSCRSNGLV